MTCYEFLRRSAYLTLFFLTLPLIVIGSTPKLQERLGAKTVNLIKQAQFITVLSMIPSDGKEVHLNIAEMEKLKRNLLDDHNYDFGICKSRHFSPEISFKFIGENRQALYLFVSPTSSQLLFAMGSRSLLLNYAPAQERLEYFLGRLVADAAKRSKNRYTQGSR